MTRRREVDQHLRQLNEIGDIMRSMKNLALMETRKLARFLSAQQETVRVVESVAADFLHFYPEFRPAAVPESEDAGGLLLVIGSERGFCGDFNDELLRLIARRPEFAGSLLIVGTKLGSRFQAEPGRVSLYDGASVSEDVPATLNRLLADIEARQRDGPFLWLTVLSHRHGEDEPAFKTILPPFSGMASGVNSGIAPLLNLPPAQFFAELVEHYLFAVLHQLFHGSLMAENHHRVQHLEGAIQRLDEKIAVLARHSQALRQEEITEEIEVILLSVEEAMAGRVAKP